MRGPSIPFADRSHWVVLVQADSPSRLTPPFTNAHDGLMRATSRAVDRDGDSFCVSMDIDGFRLWYRITGAPSIGSVGNAALCAAIVSAMRRGENLHIDGTVSNQLLESAGEAQEAFSCWYGFKKVNVSSRDTEESQPTCSGAGSFFSGGVDGTYTFLKNRERITHLLFTRGIDMQIDNESLFRDSLAANQQFAEEFGVKLVVIETNIRHFLAATGSNWVENNGPGLASMAHLVGFPVTYIAASHCYDELFPWGSHVCTDHLWSSEGCRLIHDGVVRRSVKLRFIAQTPGALRNLRVCWQDAGYNCGTCAKCLRTRIALRLMGLSCNSLGPIESMDDLRSLRIDDESDLTFFTDNLRLAEDVGDSQIAGIMRRNIIEWRRRRAIVSIDRDLTGGLLKAAYRKLRGHRGEQRGEEGRRGGEEGEEGHL